MGKPIERFTYGDGKLVDERYMTPKDVKPRIIGDSGRRSMQYGAEAQFRVPKEMEFAPKDKSLRNAEDNKPPFVPPVSEWQKRINKTQLLRVLGAMTKPAPPTATRLLTGLPGDQEWSRPRIPVYSHAELAKMFNIDPSTVSDHLRKAGVRGHRLPEVKQGEVPGNERAFYMGIAMGDIQTKKVHRVSGDMIIVGSINPEKDQLLKDTLGTWGRALPTSRQTNVYVDAGGFDFLQDPHVNAAFLDARSRYAPFLLALLLTKLSQTQSRLSLHPKHNGALELIHRKYEMHFGKNIGGLRTEKVYAPGSKDKIRKVIKVNDPEDVLETLLQEPSITALPFFDKLPLKKTV